MAKRLTAAQWAEAAGLWETGEFTLDALSKRFGVAPETMSRRFTRMGAKKGSSASKHSERVREEMAKKSVEDASIIAERARQTKEQHYSWAAALSRMTMSKIAECAKSGRSLAFIDDEIKTIKRAMDVVKIGREERFAALGLDRDDWVDDDALEELPITEMSASDVEDVRQRQMDQALGLSGDAPAVEPNDVVEEGESEGEVLDDLEDEDLDEVEEGDSE